MREVALEKPRRTNKQRISQFTFKFVRIYPTLIVAYFVLEAQ